MPRTVVTSRTGITPSRNVLSLTRIVAAIRTVMDGAPVADFEAPLVNNLMLRFGQGAATFTRASTATVTDFEGILRTVKSGEARFEGARRVENLFTNSQNFTAWSGALGGLTANNQTSPIGDLTASTYAFDTVTNTNIYKTIANNASGSDAYTFSIWIKKISGSSSQASLRIARIGGLDVLTTNITVTTSWQRFSITHTTPWTGSTAVYAGLVNGQDVTVAIWGAQLENVTGQANQNPSEYVSTGVLTSAPYHGANVDGVKYFTTENGNTVASNVVTEATGAAIPDATLKGYVAEGSRTNLVLNSAVLATQNVTVSATPYTLSFYGTGSVALSGTYTGILAGIGANNRVSLTFTPTAGTLTLTITGSVTMGQLEQASFPSSYIPTTTASVTRNGDVLYYPTVWNIDMSLGTAYAEASFRQLGASLGKVLGGYSANFQINRLNTPTTMMMYDGSSTAILSTGTYALNTRHKIASKWLGASNAGAVNGGSVTYGAFDGNLGPDSLFMIGGLSGSAQSFSTIRNVKIWKKALTDDQLITLTT